MGYSLSELWDTLSELWDKLIELWDIINYTCSYGIH